MTSKAMSDVRRSVIVSPLRGLRPCSLHRTREVKVLPVFALKVNNIFDKNMYYNINIHYMMDINSEIRGIKHGHL